MMDKGDRMHTGTDSTGAQKGKWMALLAALLGWMFDGFEIGMFPLVGPTALDELLAEQLLVDPTLKAQWFGVIMSVFLIGAATGGVLFGWLGDRIGRVRAMALSIATYALFTGLCGFASEAWHIAVLRFIASLGMGGEWALGVALVTEIWSDKSRAFLAGLIGAAANVGMLLVGLLSLVLVSFIDGVGNLFDSIGMSEATQTYLLNGEGWRLLMIAGALPAVLVFFIRMFVPESKKWEAERDKGSTSLWATRDLLGVLMGGAAAAAVIFLWSPAFMTFASPEAKDPTSFLTAIRILGTIVGLGIALVGYMFPVVRYLHRAEAAGSLPAVERKRYLGRMLLGAGLAGVALLGTWGSLQWAPKWAIALAAELPAEGGPYFAKEYTQITLAAGAIFGTIIAALVAGRIGRKITYALLCVASFVSLVYMYKGNTTYDAMMLVSVFVAGGTTAAFYGWFPLYLPELFPTSIRATCQGFSFNFGRVLSAIGSLQTATLTAWFAIGVAPERIEIEAFPAAGATLAGIYIVGVFLIWLGPETKGKPLPS
jgi:SHS family sialic acid transporter-like MFS transporter